MATTKKKTGPKTPHGKVISSGNSTDHGLRSNKLANETQKVLYEKLLTDLTTYYDPQGPIEKLELERIAICKAKLESLYELERSKFQLLQETFDKNIEQEIDSMKFVKPLVAGMLKELYRFDFIALPFNLEPTVLSNIALEISDLTQPITSTEELHTQLPTLVKFIDSLDVDSDLLSNILFIGDQIKSLISQGSNYTVTIQSLIEETSNKQLESLDFDDLEDELEEYQKDVALRHGLKPKAKVDKSTADGFPTQSEITGALEAFKGLADAYSEANSSLSTVLHHLDLRRKALSLPQEESDLLMRYQTSWERRLSTAIGELMELRRARLPKLKPISD